MASKLFGKDMKKHFYMGEKKKREKKKAIKYPACQDGWSQGFDDCWPVRHELVGTMKRRS